MEGTGQNFVAAEHLSTTRLNPNSSTITFDENAPTIDFGEFSCEEFQGFKVFLDDESFNDQGRANTHDQEVSFNDCAIDQERSSWMEGTGQNFVAAEHLSTTHLNPDWSTTTFDENAPTIDFGEFNCEEFQGFKLLLDDEGFNDQGGANTPDQEASFHDYAIDLEQMLMEEDPQIQNMLESGSNDEIGGVELEPARDVSMFDDNSTTFDAENSNSADLDFRHDQLWLDEDNSNQSTNALGQDITIFEFVHDRDQKIVQEHRPRVPELVSIEMETPEIGSTEQVVVPRPVVSPTESIGVTYHRTNKQWEAHLWLKNQQHRNNRKKKGVQLFLGNFATSHEAKQAHDRSAIKLGIRESSRGKAYPLNFPESAHADFIAEHESWSARDFLWMLRRTSAKFSKGKSRMKGVSVRKGKKAKGPAAMYEAKISRTSSEGAKVTYNLGMFESEDDAGKAYDRALLFLKGVEQFTSVTNFRPSGYSAEEIAEAGRSLVSE